MTRVVHCQKERCGVYIGRPSKWGNPYSEREGTLARYKVSSREEAIAKYRAYILERPDLLAVLEELRGKTLGCWCAPKPCHGDVLVALLDDPLLEAKRRADRDLWALRHPGCWKDPEDA